MEGFPLKPPHGCGSVISASGDNDEAGDDDHLNQELWSSAGQRSLLTARWTWGSRFAAAVEVAVVAALVRWNGASDAAAGKKLKGR